MKQKLINVKADNCPECRGRRFKYNPPPERRIYKDQVIVGKYSCLCCNWQSGAAGEVR